MSVRVQVIPKTRQELERMVNPPGNQEAIPYILYDTQLYPAAGVAELGFFQTTSPDKTISNMEGSGQLPDPQYFEIWYVLMDFLAQGPSNEAVAAAGTPQIGVANDIELITKVQRAVVQLTMQDKNYGRWPATFCHSSGGATGPIDVGTGAVAQQLATNGVQDGGYPIGGGIVIPPKVGFGITLRLAAAQAIRVNTLIRISLAGVLHRKVV